MSKDSALILIIEDDLPLQNAYQTALTKAGYEIVFATTGKEGLESAKTAKPKLVLLDLMLPGGMNGFDVLERLKADQTLSKIPVFVLTNLDNEKDTALKIGADKYFVKSNISIDNVISEIDGVLKK